MQIKGICVLAVIVLIAGTAFGADAGIYHAAAGGGKTAGYPAIRNTLEDAGIGAEEFSRMSLENLLKYRVVIIPNTGALAGNEDPRWADNLRAYIVEAGGSLVFCHDSVGAERSPFGRIPLFPEIVMTGTVKRQDSSEVKVSLGADYDRYFDYLPGYDSGETAEHMYYDRFMFVQSGGTSILSDPETGKTVVGTGEAGRGRVVFNGMYGGYRGSPAMELSGIDRDVYVNTVKWALAGDGLAFTSADEMKVARWSPEVESAEAENKIALVCGGYSQGLRRHVAEEALKLSGISYDFIPFDFISVRGLDKKDYPVSVIFLPGSVDEAGVETIKSYLDSGGRAVVFLPHTGLRAGGIARLLGLFSLEGGSGYRNTFRPDKTWARFRKIVFTDPDHLPAQIENMPRVLSGISSLSDDARVIAYWEDLENELRIPAVVRHERGYVFNNNSRGNSHNFRIFLATAVIELLPEAGSEVYSNLLELYRDRAEEVIPAVTPGEGMGYLREARRLERMAEGALRGRDYKRAGVSLIRAEESLVKAYAVSMESVKDEVRLAFATGLTDPEETAARFKKGGLTGIAMHQAQGMYPSELYDWDLEEDIFKEWVDTFHRHDLKIGIGWAPFYLYPGSEVHRRALEENWMIVPPGDYGKPAGPLPEDTGRISTACYSRREVTGLAVARAIEVAQNYPVDYIFLDGIRWPSGGGGMRYCVCDYCREHFQKDMGIQVENWPGDALGKYIDEFNGWRAEQITRVVRETSQQAKDINPDIKIGVYVRGLGANVSEGQLWWTWGDYVDFVMPMSYSQDAEITRERIMDVNRLLPEGRRARNVPCLNPVSGYNSIDPMVGLRQLGMQRELAPAGIMYWSYSQLTDTYLELLGMGPFRQR